MSDEIEIRPLESREPGEGSEHAEAQKLDDATYEPRAYVEQTGDYQQSETIQDTFSAVVENAVSEAGSQNPTISDLASAGLDSVACDGSSKDEALPLEGDVRVTRRFTWEAQAVPDNGMSQPDVTIEVGETAGEVSIPLNPPMREVGGNATSYKVDVGDIPLPLPHPAVEGGQEIVSNIIAHMVDTMENPNEILQSFNLQYLMLQNKISQENRQFSMESNIVKDDHDTAKNSINNIR